MAEEKTEQPTARKLAEARRLGEVPRSADLGWAIVLLGVLAVLYFTSEGLLSSLTQSFVLSWQVAAGDVTASPSETLIASLSTAVAVLAPVLAVVVMGALSGSVLQVGGLFAHEAVAPKLARLDVAAGLGRLFGSRSLAELVRSIVKVVAVAVVVAITLGQSLRGLLGLGGLPPEAALRSIGSVGFTLLLRTSCVLLALGVLDLFYQRWRFRRDQRMSRHELLREQREGEGDPQVKRARQRDHREARDQHVVGALNPSDLVLVDPLRRAVALRYRPEVDAAPWVMAVGEGALLHEILTRAADARATVLVDPNLVTALTPLSIGQVIAAEHFESVARLLQQAKNTEERT